MENISLETIPRGDSGPPAPPKRSGPSAPPKRSGPSACPSCRVPVSETENFCPQCGAKLKEQPGLSKVERPLSTSAGRQAFIYLISFFLAPFGLGYAFKYLKQQNPEARRVGIIVIILTVLAIAVMVWATSALTAWEYQLINTF